jgi:c-di-GMP-binding flagellar brake protein YcgR
MDTLDVRQSQRRKYDRMPIVVLCDISKPETGAILGRGCVLNYSKGGLAVVSTAALPFMSMVNVNVDGLDQKGFISARVVNDRMVLEDLHAYGLQFDGFNPIDRLQIVRKFRRLFRILVNMGPS